MESLYEVKITTNDRVLEELDGGLYSVPKNKPCIAMIDGFEVRYRPDPKEASKSGWTVVCVDKEKVMEIFGLAMEDLELREFTGNLMFDAVKLLKVPKAFTIVLYKNQARLVPNYEFWTTEGAPGGSKLPIIHIESFEYPLIVDDDPKAKRIDIVLREDVRFYEAPVNETPEK